jgi:hypothetical protein
VQTITFYAYKGGTGRSLALANAAKYLARLGQRVFAIDLDLEAPGLHHKLRLNSQDSMPEIQQGVVDCIYNFAAESRIPESLTPYTVDVPSEEERDGTITLMPAGNIVTSAYWKRLAELNWHDLFYKEESKGLLFFIELKERIRAEFKPDFLLIDARTGITEIGGVATTLLPDLVVCLLLNNRENLEGVREVIRGVNRVSAGRKKPIGIVPVLARLPAGMRRGAMGIEDRVAEQVHSFLSEPENGHPVGNRVELPAVSVLHADESLAYHESLRIGENKGVEESPLLRDYLRLFAQIIPNEKVEPHLDRLIASAMKDLLEKPERVQNDLEALTIYCPHPTSYLALLKFYRLRNAPAPKILNTAARYWELSRRSDPLLRDIVWEYYKQVRPHPSESMPQLAEFVEAIWRALGANDAEVGLRLVDHLLSLRAKERAQRVMNQLLAGSDVPPAAVVGCILRLIEVEDFKQAQALISQWASTLADNPEFQAAWASLVVRVRDTAGAKKLFESKEFRPASILAKRPQIYIQLLRLADRLDELEAALQTSLDQAIASGDMDHIMQTGMMFEELGKSDLFRIRIKDALPRHRADRVLEMLPHQRRHFGRHSVIVED